MAQLLKNKELSIIQWNCNGFHSHLGELQKLTSDTNPQYICLQETRLHNHQHSHLKGFTVTRKDRFNNNNASGGVAIFSRNTIYAEEIPLNTNLEAVAIKTYVPRKITICNIYLPPNNQIPKHEVESLIDQLPTPYIIVGDFNSHNCIWGSKHTDRRGKDIEDIIDSNDITLLNDGSDTHFSSRSGNFSCIDLTLCHSNISSLLSWDTVPLLYGSDHFPIKISILSTNSAEPNLPTVKWKVENANWPLFRIAAKISYEESQDTLSIDEHVERLTNKIITAANLALELKHPRSNRINVPLWNNKCQEAIKNNKRALYTYRKNQNVDNLIYLKKTRAIARRVIIESKKTCWQEFVSSLNTNTAPKEVWDKIRKVNGKKTMQQTSVLIDGRNVITDPQEIADKIADQFEYNSSNSQYTKTFLDYKENTETGHSTIEPDNLNPLNQPIAETEITACISELKTSSSPGPDGIPYILIKNLPTETIHYILLIYNIILQKNTYPQKWQEVNIIPILKPNKLKTDPDNYRPISLSNCLSKLLQKVINKRLLWYLEEKNILNNVQGGFRSRRSTTDQVIMLETEIQQAFINKQHLVAVFFDINKAYDTAWRYYIINALIGYGVQGNILYYIKHFLSQRKFRVKFSGRLSKEKYQQNGVPQGEIISPTLFLIAMNKIVDFIPNKIKISLYADDIAIFYKNKNINKIQNELQSAITKIQTKYVLLFPIRTATSKQITKRLEEEVFLVYGVPQTILCDNGSQYISASLKKLVKDYNVTNLWYNARFHPQTNPSERVNKVIVTAIASYVKDSHDTWDMDLAKIGCAIRTAVHEVTGYSPTFLNFGREIILSGAECGNFPQHSTDLKIGARNDFEDKLGDLDTVFKNVRKRLRQAYERNTKTYNLRRRHIEFEVGDTVWKKNYVLSNASKKFTAKLAPKFIRCTIAAKHSPLVYSLVNQDGSRIGKWHVKDLKATNVDEDES